MVAPQPPRRSQQLSLRAVVGSLISLGLILLLVSTSAADDDKENVASTATLELSSSTRSLIVSTPSPIPATIPVPTQRRDTGAFENCQTSFAQEGRIYFPELHDHSIVVSCHKLHYKLPTILAKNRFFVQTEVVVPVQLVIGILSASWESSRRDVIRLSWGKDAINRYFVVGGTDFSVVSREFSAHQDMIWIDMEENYEGLIYKTGAMLGIFQRHIRELDYVLKTDDDSYINIDELQKELKDGEGSQKEYFGHCHVNRTIPYRPFQLDKLPPYFQKFIVNKTVYPEKWNAPYCQGAGYIVGTSFLKCIAAQLPFIRYHPFEDVAIGLVAERCGIAAVRHSVANDYKWHFQVGEANLKGKILQHPVESGADMKVRYETVVGEK